MDFDLLSRRWQQQTPPPAAPPSPNDLRALLAGRAHTPVAQMRRNVWVEIGGTLFFGLVLLLVLRRWQAPRLGLLVALLLPFYGGVAYCYFRTLRVLGRLREATGALASHVAKQLQQVRQLVRLYHWATMLATGVLLSLVGYAAIRYVLPGVPAAGQARFLTWFVLTALVTFGFTYWLSRYHLQNYYGQHLDRLETVLGELRDEPPGAPVAPTL